LVHISLRFNHNNNARFVATPLIRLNRYVFASIPKSGSRPDPDPESSLDRTVVALSLARRRWFPFAPPSARAFASPSRRRRARVAVVVLRLCSPAPPSSRALAPPPKHPLSSVVHPAPSRVPSRARRVVASFVVARRRPSSSSSSPPPSRVVVVVVARRAFEASATPSRASRVDRIRVTPRAVRGRRRAVAVANRIVESSNGVALNRHTATLRARDLATRTRARTRTRPLAPWSARPRSRCT
jgi:hypothetical protein